MACCLPLNKLVLESSTKFHFPKLHLFIHTINICLALSLCPGVGDTKMNMHYLSL